MTSLSPFLHTACPVLSSVIGQAGKCRAGLGCPWTSNLDKPMSSRMLNSLTRMLFSCGAVVYLLIVTSHLCSLSELGLSFACWCLEMSKMATGTLHSVKYPPRPLHSWRRVTFQKASALNNLHLPLLWFTFKQLLDILLI